MGRIYYSPLQGYPQHLIHWYPRHFTVGPKCIAQEHITITTASLNLDFSTLTISQGPLVQL